MSVAPSQTAALARRLVMIEARGLDRPEELAEAGERAWERLRRRLTVLIGPEGFDALFARALALSRSDYPMLAGIQYEAANGYGLTGLREIAYERAPTERARCHCDRHGQLSRGPRPVDRRRPRRASDA